MNSTNLIGRLTVEPELKTTPNGISVCTFRLAVDRPHSKDVTDFIPVVAWRQTAEFISRNMVKGERIAVSGVLTARPYTDRDGQKHTAYEVIADQAEFADGKERKAASPTARETIDEIVDDDVPP